MLSSDAYPAYSYLLGLYLGDGDITSHARGVFRLRVTLDSRYPGIVSCASRAMNEVLPRNRVGVHGRTRSNATAVTCYSKSWPKLLPQHGPGVKHRRTITLYPWQRRITSSFPRELVRPTRCPVYACVAGHRPDRATPFRYRPRFVHRPEALISAPSYAREPRSVSKWTPMNARGQPYPRRTSVQTIPHRRIDAPSGLRAANPSSVQTQLFACYGVLEGRKEWSPPWRPPH